MQTNGLHFFNKKPDPSGQQYTGISVAEAAMKLIPKDEINNKTTLNKEVEKSLDLMAELPAEGSCGDAPAPLNTSLPNVLMIGDSISMPGSGCERSPLPNFYQPAVVFDSDFKHLHGCLSISSQTSASARRRAGRGGDPDAAGGPAQGPHARAPRCGPAQRREGIQPGGADAQRRRVRQDVAARDAKVGCARRGSLWLRVSRVL